MVLLSSRVIHVKGYRRYDVIEVRSDLAAAERLVRRAVGAEPAAVAAHAASRPVDEDAAAGSRVAASEPRPATGRDLLEQGARREGVGELPDSEARAVVAERRAAVVAREPRLHPRSGEDRVQLRDGRLLVRRVPGLRESPAQGARSHSTSSRATRAESVKPWRRRKRRTTSTSRRHSGSAPVRPTCSARRTANATPSLGSNSFWSTLSVDSVTRSPMRADDRVGGLGSSGGTRVLVFGAGFGGLELATVLSEALGGDAGVTLIDENDSFVFGYRSSTMFGRATLDDVVCPTTWSSPVSASCARRSGRSTPRSAGSRRTGVPTTRTSSSSPSAPPTTSMRHPGSPTAATSSTRSGRRAVAPGAALVHPRPRDRRYLRGAVQVPARAQRGALLLHDYLSERGVRDDCEISLVMPFGTPVPPSPDTSAALLAAFAERGSRSSPTASELARSGTQCVLDGSGLAYDLFLGVEASRPGRRRRADDRGRLHPRRLADARNALRGRLRRRRRRHRRRTQGGVFSEGAARVVAAEVVARLRGGEEPVGYDGRGACYVEFGSRPVGPGRRRLFSGPRPTGTFLEPSEALVAEKLQFGASRRARWFSGLSRPVRRAVAARRRGRALERHRIADLPVMQPAVQLGLQREPALVRLLLVGGNAAAVLAPR